MSVLVEIYRVPEPTEKEVQVVGIRNRVNIPFLEEDFLNEDLDLNSLVGGGGEATFYAKVKGNCRGSKYREGDVLVVNRSWPLQINSCVVCFIRNEFVIKFLKQREDGLWLEPVGGMGSAVPLDGENRFVVWGRVTFELKRVW